MASLSNEQIIAEIKWTEKAIFDIIGVIPLYWRPPYGDIDNRVRSVVSQLDIRVEGFDMGDWELPGGGVSAQSVINTFKSWTLNNPNLSTGFIVREHDMFHEQVDVAVKGAQLVANENKNLIIQPIPQCVGDSMSYRKQH
ncbi:chitin deacetylase [Podila clonocystis]|nr:chitin deacetylase [Podila clonocystis]